MATPRCVFPSATRADGMCNKTEAQHGPATGHAFTLTWTPDPHGDTSPPADLPVPGVTGLEEPTPIRRPGQESTPCPLCRRLWTGEKDALYVCVGRPGGPKHDSVYFKIGDGTPLVDRGSEWIPFAGHPDGCEHLEHTPADNPDCSQRPAMQDGDPLEGHLLSSAPVDPTVTFRAETPDGTLVEVTVAHPHADPVTMGRHALVAAEYVMGRLAGTTPATPGEGK